MTICEPASVVVAAVVLVTVTEIGAGVPTTPESGPEMLMFRSGPRRGREKRRWSSAAGDLGLTPRPDSRRRCRCKYGPPIRQAREGAFGVLALESEPEDLPMPDGIGWDRLQPERRWRNAPTQSTS